MAKVTKTLTLTTTTTSSGAVVDCVNRNPDRRQDVKSNLGDTIEIKSLASNTADIELLVKKAKVTALFATHPFVPKPSDPFGRMSAIVRPGATVVITPKVTKGNFRFTTVPRRCHHPNHDDYHVDC